jgi:MATE family multidrug resistance protein
LAFSIVMFLIGRLGNVELTATSIALTINMVALLPMLGVGQAVGILVGQRLGENQPTLAERSTWTGLKLAALYMLAVSVFYLLTPDLFLAPFRGDNDPAAWALVAAAVRMLLVFVAAYSVFDSFNIVFSFALRGAGDTRFITLVILALSWPVMVVPSWLACEYGWGLYWVWTFATAYIIALGFVFFLRFRHGRWKAMRVIEPSLVEELTPAVQRADPAHLFNGTPHPPAADPARQPTAEGQA